MKDRDPKTSAGRRAYIAGFFATQLRRHDFQRYIEERLAADFACALAQYLSERDTSPSAPAVDAAASGQKLKDRHEEIMALAIDTLNRSEHYNIATALRGVMSELAASGQKLTNWRDVCAALIDIYDDAMNNAPEDRCYVDGAWKEELDKARALLSDSATASDSADAEGT